MMKEYEYENHILTRDEHANWCDYNPRESSRHIGHGLYFCRKCKIIVRWYKWRNIEDIYDKEGRI